MALLTSSENRFAVYTIHDHRAPLWVLAILSFLYSTLFLFVRLFVKRSFWGMDDVVLGIGHVFALGQWAVLFRALKLGLGTTVETFEPGHYREAAALVSSSRILTLIAIGLSKCCVVLFLRLLFTDENKASFRLCTICVGVAAVWTIAAPLIVSIGCSTSHALETDPYGACPGDLTRWKLVTAIDMFLEAGLLVLPAYLFSTLRMTTDRKLAVTAAFAFRLGVMGVFIVYLVTYEHFRDRGRSNIGAVTPLIWQQVLLATALLTATIPCLKGVLGRFKTLDLVTITSATTACNGRSYGSTLRSGNRTFAISSIDHRSDTRGKEQPAPDETPIRQHEGEFTAIAYSCPNSEGKAGSTGSFASDQMIIHRMVEIESGAIMKT